MNVRIRVSRSVPTPIDVKISFFIGIVFNKGYLRETSRCTHEKEEQKKQYYPHFFTKFLENKINLTLTN